MPGWTRFGWGWAVAGLLLATAGGHAQETPLAPEPAPPDAVCSPPLTAKALLKMSRCELEAIYRQAQPGELPSGYYPGKAIWLAGTKWTLPMALGSGLIWYGKNFDPCSMTMTNKSLTHTTAAVYYGPSWLDGQPSIIMDYADTSKLMFTLRDEIREVAPGLYLGIMFVRRDGGCTHKFRNFFALEAKPCCCK